MEGLEHPQATGCHAQVSLRVLFCDEDFTGHFLRRRRKRSVREWTTARALSWVTGCSLEAQRLSLLVLVTGDCLNSLVFSCGGHND